MMYFRIFAFPKLTTTAYSMIRKHWRKILGIILLLPVLLFVTVAALVYRYEDELVAEAISRMNSRISGEIKVEAVKISPFKKFPYISIDLQNIRFYETIDTTCRPLYQFEDVYLGFDVQSILAGHYDIKSIVMERGHLDLIHHPDGTYNIMAAKALLDTSYADTSETAMHLDLKLLQIKDIDLVFLDELADRELDLHIHNLNAGIRYRYQHFYIDLLSDLHLDVVEQGNLTFFSNKALHLDLELDYDENCGLLNVLPSKASLEKAHFRLAGSVDMLNEMDISLAIEGEKPDFSVFAAFLPADIAKGLETYQNAGQIFFKGQVEGKAINGHLPLVTVDFGCENAYFLNKAVNKKVEALRFTGSFTNGADRTLKSSILQLRNMYAKPEEGVFEGQLYIKNFEDPIVKVDVHADLDLEFIGKFFQLEQLEEVSGKILLDMNFNEIVDLNFPGESLAKLKTGIDSDLIIRELNFRVPEYGHLVSDVNGHAMMREGAITLDSISLRIGESDLWVEGSISDFPALFHRYDKPLRTELALRANKIDLPDLFAFDTLLAKQYDEVVENLSLSLAFETQAKEFFDFTYLPKGEFFVDDFYAKLQHYPHTLHDFHADVIITEKDFQLIDFSGEIDSTDFHFSGKLINYTKWFQDQPKGDSQLEFDLTSTYLTLHDLLSYKDENYIPEEYRDEVFRDSKLHGRVDMHYDGGFQSVDLYLDEFTSKTLIHPLKFERFKGRAHIENDHLLLEEFSGRMGKSDFLLNMSYFLGEDKTAQTRDDYIVLKSKMLDIDDLFIYEESDTAKAHDEAFNIFDIPFPNLRLVADIGHLNYHNYHLYDVSTVARIQENHYLYLDTLSVGLADGRMDVKGYFNGSDPKNIYFYSDLKADKLDLDKLLLKFDNFGQDVLVNDNLHGRLSGKVVSTFRIHPDFTPITDKSEAHMELEITQGSIHNFAPILAFSDYFQDKNLRIIRFDTLQNTLDLKDGILFIPSMLINSSIGFLELSGQQSLDLSMTYFIRLPLKLVTQVAWRKLFGGKNQEEVDAEQIDEIDEVGDLQKIRFVNIKITGTPDDYKIQLGRDKSQKRAERDARRAERQAKRAERKGGDE